MRYLGLCILILSGLLHTPALARDHYVAPLDQAVVADADGTAKAPWRSFDESIARGGISGGDRIILLPGYHGPLIVRGLNFSKPVEIRAYTQGTARVRMIKISKSKNLTVAGLSVWHSKGDEAAPRLVETGPASSNITFTGLDVRGHAYPDEFQNWSKAEWLRLIKSSGFRLAGPQNTVADSSVRATTMAITTLGKDARVINNRIQGFRADAMRGLGSGSVFRGNVISDCVKVDGNHDDGFQSWSLKDGQGNPIPVVGMLIEDNVIVEWAGRENHPLRCTLQGISVFDGLQKNLTVRNNLVSVSAYHGISVYGGDGITVANNTVVNALGHAGERPWIGFFEIKNTKTPASNVKLINNIAPRFVNRTRNKRLVRAGGNIEMHSPLRGFVDVVGGDFRFLAGGSLDKQPKLGFQNPGDIAPLPFQTE